MEAKNLIKKHRNKNEYYYTGSGLWVRNFTKKSVHAVDINNLINEKDMVIMLENETINYSKIPQRIDTESFSHNKIIIVSDGFNFTNNQKLLEQLPNDVTIIGVNEILKNWTVKNKINYYVVNNPYPECMQLLPENLRIFPILIASTRTHTEFMNKFKNLIYSYSPTTDLYYSGQKSESDYFIDDYRNPICAAIGLSYIFEVKKLMLFCCDNVLTDQRPASEKISNDLWVYPQQRIAHELIDGNLYWLRKAGVMIGNYTHGIEYKNSEYIKENDIAKFFA
jgi:hypothetical protein